MLTSTYTETVTFTVAHARHMAAKVATDLKRMQRFYQQPSDLDIGQFEAELIELLREGVLGTVAYGFQRNGAWIVPTLRYNERDLLGGSANDDDPGHIRPGADISNASFYSYLTYNWKWLSMGSTDKQTIKDRLPFQRGEAPQPSVNGYFSEDKIYSAGGRALNRATVRSF